MKDKKEIAVQFGKSLDRDAFDETKKLLSLACTYDIGSETLVGPDAICNSYEQNMIAGRKKLDVLEWGESWIETISDAEFFVHFTDYLKHQGKEHVHKCKQRLTLNNHGQIESIKHIHNQEEQERLDSYYKEVGLK